MDTVYLERIGKTREPRDMEQEGCCYMSRAVLMQWRDGICVTRLSKRVSGMKFSLKSLSCLWEFATGCQMPPKKPIKECTNCWKGQIRKPPLLWGTSTTMLIGNIQKGRENRIDYSWILLRPIYATACYGANQRGQHFGLCVNF